MMLGPILTFVGTLISVFIGGGLSFYAGYVVQRRQFQHETAISDRRALYGKVERISELTEELSRNAKGGVFIPINSIDSEYDLFEKLEHIFKSSPLGKLRAIIIIYFPDFIDEFIEIKKIEERLFSALPQACNLLKGDPNNTMYVNKMKEVSRMIAKLDESGLRLAKAVAERYTPSL